MSEPNATATEADETREPRWRWSTKVSFSLSRRKLRIALPYSTGRDIMRTVPDEEIEPFAWDIGYGQDKLALEVSDVDLIQHEAIVRSRYSDRRYAVRIEIADGKEHVVVEEITDRNKR